MSRCYTQITLADRRRLHHLVAAKVPVNEMARQLGRHRSTIFREFWRNAFEDPSVATAAVSRRSQYSLSSRCGR
jgi:IS30 family transposase